MITLPLSEICLNSTEIKYFERALIGLKNAEDPTVCNRRVLFSLLLYLSDDKDFVNFVEAFAGRTIKIPSRQHITYLANNAKIYNYYLQNGVESTLSHFDIDKVKLDKILIYAEDSDVE